MALTPLARRRLDAFRANRRGVWSLWLFTAIFVLCLFAELLANDKPLLVWFDGKPMFPIFVDYAETDFGGDFATEADYRDPYVAKLIAAHGWALWPPIRFSYDTISNDLPGPVPSAPTRINWLGTDDSGRDVLARIIYGLRVSLLFGLALTLVSSVIGVAAGAVQGYFGGWTDLLFQRFLEVWGGLPQLFILIIVASVLVPGFWTLLGILVLFSWTGLVGVVRAEFLRARNFDYVRAARALGMSDWRIMMRHVLPNAMVATLTFMPFIINGAIVSLTSLDFLGLGMPPGSASLGELLNQGKAHLEAPWLGFSGFAVLAITLSLLVFIGEAVRDAFDPEEEPAMTALLEVRDLHVVFGSGASRVEAVRGVSFEIERGQTLALVGESGSGKSATALSVLQLLPYPRAHHPSGSIRFDGAELVGAPEKSLRQLRGNRIGMVFQEPMTSLNPLHGIGKQVAEAVRLHRRLSGRALRTRVVELLKLVGLAEAESRLRALPHELSGGQRQRVMIAMALANDPDLLIADEPTTALDVTIQAQILALLKDLQARLGMALLMITHDLGIVRKLAERVCVMQGGEIVEQGAVAEVMDRPEHPYTKHLLASEPKGEPNRAASDAPVVMETADLKVWFPIRRGLIRHTVGYIKAVDGVSISVREGQTLGVVGESGSGKTTLGLALLRLAASEGPVAFLGKPIQGLKPRELRRLRREMQIVFQDPYGSLSPRLSIGQIVGEGLEVHGLGGNATERRELIGRTLIEVGLDPAARDRFPHEFSGGQRQRVGIARALVLKPRFIVLDEPTSALDLSVQAQIVTLLRELQQRHRLAFLFISHDLRVVRALAEQVAVMKDGKVVEAGTAEDIFRAPRHPYTRTLMAAAFDLAARE